MILSSLPRLLLLLALSVCLAPAWADAPARNLDPWEPINRKVFFVNDKLDQYVLKPVARGYRFVMPDVAERGVTNFIGNIYEFNYFLNNLLQGEIKGAARNGGRFLVNSTLGIAGLFDVASRMGIEPHLADFGQTLAVWGMDTGPYLVLPLFGPRTLRSGIGYFVDTYTSIPAFIDDREAAYAFWTVEVIDLRAQLLDAEDLITGDRYIFIRDAYLQRRAAFISGGVVQDSFSDFETQDENWEDF